MLKIAKVVVERGVEGEFEYLIPSELQHALALGSKVDIPFGRSRATGYIVGFSQGSKRDDLKPVIGLANDGLRISDHLLQLARWMSEYYCTSLERALRTVLPGAVRGRKAGFKNQSFVRLVERSDASAAWSGLPPRQQAVVDHLRDRGAVSRVTLARELGISSAPINALARKGIVEIVSESVRRDPLGKRRVLRTEPLKLMPEQAVALDLIRRKLTSLANVEYRDVTPGNVILLHGVTGSGKTEVYLQAIDHALGMGRGAIVLVPEISLTPQTVGRFHGRFGERIAVLHSHLSDGERHDEWHRIVKGEADIVIGARSAVFAPVSNLGIIVVDEEHESSYKQEEAPRYNARDVAVMRGHMEDCVVVLGSATPCLESWSNVGKKKYQLAELTKRVDDRKMPHVRIIDMRLQSKTGRFNIFSSDLLEAIGRRLERAEQTILFLNRRGYSTSLICTKCGHVAECRHCSVSLTYHRSREELRCHICGARSKVPQKCPSCGDPSFKFSGVGTQKVESVLAKCFPQARIQRIDADITTAKDSYERILGDFRVGKTNILVGTQMIAKGLHFPNVTLVGVIYADLSLHMPDFRAGERTFQLLAQVAGRAGRGDAMGEVIVQTYTPFNPSVQAARRLDYAGFCDQELAFRRELRYPPFTHLVCINLKGLSEARTAFCANDVYRKLVARLPSQVVLAEPAPAPLAKAKGLYRYQIIMRGISVRTMTKAIHDVLQHTVSPRGVTVTVDVDALNLL